MYVRPVGIGTRVSTLPLLPPRSARTTESPAPLLPPRSARTTESPAAGFQAALRRAVASLEEMDRDLLRKNMELVSGAASDMHSAVLAAEKASLALDLIIAIRNKAIEAYQEIMRMPI